MSFDFDGNYTISWKEKNPLAKPKYFQVQEISNITISTDRAETGELWILEGFSITSSKYHSDFHSFKSRNTNYDVSSMTTIYPTPISKGMNLSFWCWYNLEKEWDYAFVEVSFDGRRYELLDTFTGNSGGWVRKEYSLDKYADESIFIRFRSTTDAQTLEDGFYVDDIFPVADFISLNSSFVTENYFRVEGRQEGTYYYRVRGYNKRGWGDFSTLEKVIVGEGENEPPFTPYINGPTTGRAGVEYSYTLVSTDPNGDDLNYLIEWGDGESEWKGPRASGEEITVKHSWSQRGTYTIRVRSFDIYGAESPVGTLKVSMPKNVITPRYFPYRLYLSFLKRGWEAIQA
jgi:hypothetical protein